MISRNATPLSPAEQMKKDLSNAETPYDILLVASAHGDIELSKELINAGVPVNPDPTMVTDTPLCLAVYRDKLEMVQFLIDNGANVNQPSRLLEFTPLESAINDGNLDIFNLLLQCGANPHHINSHDQDTLLHSAAELAEYKFDKALIIINKLLELGVDYNLRNSSGETPHDIAKRNMKFWKRWDACTAIKNFSILDPLLSQTKTENKLYTIENETALRKYGKALAKLGLYAHDALGNPIPPLASSLLNGFVGFKKL